MVYLNCSTRTIRNGERIDPDQTIDMLGLEGNDVIDCVVDPETTTNNKGPITFCVKDDQTGEETFYKISRSQKISTVFDHQAKRMGVEEAASLHFFRNWERIGPDQTPDMLGLEEEDVIVSVRRDDAVLAELKRHRWCKEGVPDDNREVIVETHGKGSCVRCWSDQDLFKKPPPREVCPICLLTLPMNFEEALYDSYQDCCGKILCSGCMHSADNSCPFCRTPREFSNMELVDRAKVRVEADDAVAMYILGCKYYYGENGLPRDCEKAIELWLRGGELGYPGAYCNIGIAYCNGERVKRDAMKAKYYYELAAMGRGCGSKVQSRPYGGASRQHEESSQALDGFCGSWM